MPRAEATAAMAAAVALGVGAALYLWARGASREPLPPVAPRAAQAPAPAPAKANPNAVKVIYGSNTGTAELFAKTLRSEASSRGFDVRCVDGATVPALLQEPDANDPEALEIPRTLGPEKNIILVLATYGEGDPTDSCVDLVEALRRTAKAVQGTPVKPLAGFNVAVFGLGDSSYKYFCKVGSDVAALLEQLGATLMLDRGEGDARFDLEESFDQWREELWGPLSAATGVNGVASGRAVEPDLTFNYVDAPENADIVRPFPPPASAMEPSLKTPFVAKIVMKEEIVNAPPARSNSEARSRTLHVELDINGARITYQAGDHLGLLPAHSDALVQAYLDALHITAEDAQRVVELTSKARANQRASPANTLPRRVTLSVALKWYVALAAAPKKATLRVLAQYCTDEAERDAFRALLSGNDAVEFRGVLQKHRTVLHFLRAFPSCRVPIGHFLEVMPRTAPRYFSVASDQLAHPTTVRIVVGLVEGGLCSELLDTLSVGDAVHIFVRKSTFHLPLRHKAKPVIMIGAGTGLAPYIGFCERRAAWRTRKTALGAGVVVFGCRRRSEDFIFEKELTAWADPSNATNDGRVLTHLLTAFSREQDKKVYVQHLVAEHAAAMAELITKQGAYVYICGDATNMASAVEQALLDAVLVGAEGMPPPAAAELLKRMEKEGRFLKDVWTA